MARCTVKRLMQAMGIKGVVRGRNIVTTRPDAARPCPDDKADRLFKAERPDQFWVSDFTYVPAWCGTVYVAFVIDVFARKPSEPCSARNSPPGCFVRASPDRSASVGWRVSTSMSTQFVLDALDWAIFQRKSHGNNVLIHHSDRGAQYLSITCTERLAEAGIDPSVGTVGDSDDNALAESVIGLVKTEAINALGPWRTFRDVAWETLKWIDLHNNRRLLAPSDTSRPRRPSRPTPKPSTPSTKPRDR